MRNSYKIIVLVFGIFFFQEAYAQPANDACAGATAIPTNGGCVGATTAGAGDHWVGTVGCQASNNVNEVWFSFVATGTQADITVTNGTMTGNVEIIIVESTSGGCGTLSLNGDGCGPSPMLATTSNLQIGTTYFVTVNSTGADGTFSICNLNSTPPPVPGTDCPTAAVLCDNSGFSQGAFTGIGVGEEISNNSCFGADERQAKWYTFTVDETGDFEFLINPNTNTDDYDWALWNTTSGCYTSAVTMGAPIACNWSGCPGNTGVLNAGTDPCTVTDFLGCANGPSCNAGDVAQFSTSPPTLTAGETYTILIDNFSSSGGGFAVDFIGTGAGMGPDATFAAPLDATCMTVNIDRLTNYIGANMTYSWNFGDGFTSTAATPSHTYATTGSFTISLEVTDALGCIENFSLTVDIGCVLPIELINFTAKYNGNTVDLDWITATEINNDFFTIERTKDGVTYEVVAIVDGNGNSNTVLNYYLEDRNPFTGTSFYRLKQTDYDGESSVSNLVAVNVKSNFTGIDVYPNPITGLGYLFFKADRGGDFTIVIYDVTGRKVLTESYIVNEGSNELELPTKELTAGMYFLTIGNSNETEKIKFIKE